MTLFSAETDRLERFSDAIDALFTAPAVSIPFFSDSETEALRKAAGKLEYRTARSVVGNGVHQDFDICFPAPLEGVFSICATLLEQAVAYAGQMQPGLTETPFFINDFAVQNYPAGSRGIGIHKDGLRYRHFVFIITLDGQSDLFVCSDREGADRQLIDDRPGHLVILPAPGFSGLPDEGNRPLHGVDNVTGGRLSIGFRHERVSNL